MDNTVVEILGGGGGSIGTRSVFSTLKSMEIFNAGFSSYRAEIVSVNEARFVVLHKYFYDDEQEEGKKWVPTKKQIFLPPPAWYNLVKNVGYISNALKSPTAIHGPDAATATNSVASASNYGMKIIVIFGKSKRRE